MRQRKTRTPLRDKYGPPRRLRRVCADGPCRVQPAPETRGWQPTNGLCYRHKGGGVPRSAPLRCPTNRSRRAPLPRQKLSPRHPPGRTPQGRSSGCAEGGSTKLYRHLPPSLTSCWRRCVTFTPPWPDVLTRVSRWLFESVPALASWTPPVSRMATPRSDTTYVTATGGRPSCVPEEPKATGTSKPGASHPAPQPGPQKG